MASVQRRTRNGKAVGYDARWRDPQGRQKKKFFRKKSDADRFKTAMEHAVLVGSYVDPAAGKVTVDEWAKTWMSQRVHLKAKTLAGYESLLRSRVLPRWGKVQLGRVQHA